MVILRRDMGAIGVGVTAPRLMLGADGHLYVVKLMNNKVGPKALANEWLGWRLARRIGLCVPRCEQVEVTRSLLVRSPRLRKVHAAEGVHFGSRYLAGCEYVGRGVMQRAVNKDEVVGVMLFDHLLYNDDRTLNRKNFLARWEGRGYHIYAIDHSHLLGSGRWSAESLLRRSETDSVNQRRVFGWLLRYHLTKDKLAPYVTRILSITEDEVRAVLEEIPPEWLTEAERDVVLRFWQMRQREVVDIAERLARSAADMHRRAKRRKIE